VRPILLPMFLIGNQPGNQDAVSETGKGKISQPVSGCQ